LKLADVKLGTVNLQTNLPEYYILKNFSDNIHITILDRYEVVTGSNLERSVRVIEKIMD